LVTGQVVKYLVKSGRAVKRTRPATLPGALVTTA
jgi:hypothetical protein